MCEQLAMHQMGQVPLLQEHVTPESLAVRHQRQEKHSAERWHYIAILT